MDIATALFFGAILGVGLFTLLYLVKAADLFARELDQIQKRLTDIEDGAVDHFTDLMRLQNEHHEVVNKMKAAFPPKED